MSSEAGVALREPPVASPPDRFVGLPAVHADASGAVRWRSLLALIAALTLARLVVASVAPVSFDEALYWRYSRHLAAGYIDHPFINPLAIRIGTSLLGPTPLGIRLVSVLSSLPASWAVWRASLAVFKDEAVAARALLYVNLTAVFSVGAIAATSDEMVVAAACGLILCLARLEETKDGRWWWGVGAILGLGLCAKYTMVFFVPGTAAWVLSSPARRAWLRDARMWAGAALAAILFSPVLIWNAEHHWASFVYQSGRLTVFKPTGRYVLEYLGAIVLFATPPIFVLGVIGTARLAQGAAEGRGRLLIALALPLGTYLLWHSTHQRVQGNWVEPALPALAIAAAYAAERPVRAGRTYTLVRACTRLAVPIAVTLAGFVYIGVATPLFPTGSRDLRARALGVGWPALDGEIEATRERSGARLILTTDYTIASWGLFYSVPGVRFEQIDERVRWSNEPPPPPALLAARALYVCKEPCAKLSKLASRYSTIALDHVAARLAKGRVVDRYGLYVAADPIRPVLDQTSAPPLADHVEDDTLSPEHSRRL